MKKAKRNEAEIETVLRVLSDGSGKFPDLADIFSAREIAILRYSVKLTKTPATIESADVNELRENGLNDRAIHDLACVVGYFAFVNRVADGLGVQVE